MKPRLPDCTKMPKGEAAVVVCYGPCTQNLHGAMGMLTSPPSMGAKFNPSSPLCCVNTIPTPIKKIPHPPLSPVRQHGNTGIHSI